MNERDDDLDPRDVDVETESPALAREKARGKVAAPAIVLLIWSVLSAILCVYSFTQVPEFDEKWDKGMAEQEVKMASKPKAEQDAWENIKGIMNKIKEPIKYLTVGVTITGFLISVVTIPAMLKMKKLEGYGLAKAAAILNLLPCLTTCCLISMPFGLWALIVLNNTDVKRAFATSGR